MNTYQQDVAQSVFQAAIHFHDAPEPIGTALYDSTGAVVFDDGASEYADEPAMIGAVVDCTVNPVPGALFQCDSETTTAFAMSLDGNYMFVIVGHQIAPDSIEQFLTNLDEIFPNNPSRAH